MRCLRKKKKKGGSAAEGRAKGSVQMKTARERGREGVRERERRERGKEREREREGREEKRGRHITVRHQTIPRALSAAGSSQWKQQQQQRRGSSLLRDNTCLRRESHYGWRLLEAGLHSHSGPEKPLMGPCLATL